VAFGFDPIFFDALALVAALYDQSSAANCRGEQTGY